MLFYMNVWEENNIFTPNGSRAEYLIVRFVAVELTNCENLKVVLQKSIKTPLKCDGLVKVLVFLSINMMWKLVIVHTQH